MIHYEYFCRNCGEAFLDDFSPVLEYYTCQCCGETMFNPSVYSGEKYPEVYWVCDKCNSLLNSQLGFRDINPIWKCTSCGYDNHIDDDHM